MYQTEDPWSSVLHLQAVHEFLRTHAGRNYRYVLDAGCGEGIYAEGFLKIAQSYLGVDISATAIARAREKHAGSSARFLQSDVFSLDLSRNRPDLVVFNFVLDYLGFQKFPKTFSAHLYSFLRRIAADDADILIVNPIYGEKNSEDFAKYLFLFKNFGWELSAKAGVKLQGYELAMALLKPNKIKPNGSGVQEA